MQTTPKTQPEEADLGLAAFLVVRGIGIARTRLDGRRVHFIFDASEETVAKLRSDWWSGADQVSARTYADVHGRLKRLAFSVLDGGSR